MMMQCNSCFKTYTEDFGICPHCGYVNNSSANEAFCLNPGTKIANRYKIGGLLGIGGFGITYRAWDENLNTVLAIKEFYPSNLVNRIPGENQVLLVATKRKDEFDHGKTRFLQEAQNMARFSTDANIVNVFDYFEANNTAYIVMEFLEGHTLSQELIFRNAPLPWEDCEHITHCICAALHSLHKERILHRDISPDNIMLCDNGNVKLLDFGAARFAIGTDNLHTVVIKPGFAPAEQYEKISKQDGRTDIYALGATLYYTLTGVRPEESTNRKILDTLEEPALCNDQIPPKVSTAIMRAMAVEQHYRYSTVQTFEEALFGIKPVISLAKERSRRKRKRLIGIVATFVVLAGAAWMFIDTYNDSGLPDATLTLWYVDRGDESIITNTLNGFQSTYPNVTIVPTAISAEDYADVVTEATASNTLPDILETSCLEDISTLPANDISHLIQEIDTYVTLPASSTQYPTSIIVPIIYVNTLLEPNVTLDTIDNYTDFADVGDQADFISGDIAIYYGDSTSYNTICDAMPGKYQIFMPDTTEIAYRTATTWSVFSNTADNQAVVDVLLPTLSNLHYYYVTTASELPLDEAILSEFWSVYDELQEAAPDTFPHTTDS